MLCGPMSARTPSPADLDARSLAKRALARALAMRGRAEASGADVAAALTGVHVAVTPAVEASATPRGKGRALIDAASLRGVPDGGDFEVPRGALLTDLARDEAARRGIRLLDGATARASRSPSRRVAVGSDHGGFRLKQDVLAWLPAFEAVGLDVGTRDENPCDYPDFARAVALAVARGEVDFGIVIDGAGIGSAIAANKVPGVRAAPCHDVALARNAREHNFANVLTLGAKFVGREQAYQIIHAFLTTPTGAERHRKRVEKIEAIERESAARP